MQSYFGVLALQPEGLNVNPHNPPFGLCAALSPPATSLCAKVSNANAVKMNNKMYLISLYFSVRNS